MSLRRLSGGGQSRGELRLTAGVSRSGPKVSGTTSPLTPPQLPPSGGIAPKQAHALDCPPPDNRRRDISSARSSPASRVTPIRSDALAALQPRAYHLSREAPPV